jgi:hypothetical protein
VYLLCVELARLAGLYHLSYILESGWPGGEGKRRDPQGTQDTHLRLLEKAWRKLGQRASVRAMGEPDHTQPSYRGDLVLPGLRGRSLPSPGNHYGLPTGPGFR